ncbi:MAG TPA: shikimate dehydrogenase [Acidimicrobiales bacterium]|nr:shikimate dehydrogenase [Acidimicrobiales bacterium]
MTAEQPKPGRPITGHTQLAAVIGAPVRHSISPAIHNAAFAAVDLDWVYLAFDVREGEAKTALDAVRALGIRGLSVTMPHKSAVADAVDELSDAARELRAVNCVVNRDGWLFGDNTDGAGFVDAFRHDSGGDVAGRRCGVIGGGGAARAVVRALAGAGASEVIVVNRSAGAAAGAAALAGTCGRVGALDDLSGCAVVVNATPLGMAGPLEAAVPVPLHLLRPGQVLVDLVYNPLETPWLAAARERGIEAHNGLSMLVFQAARAFGHWTGVAAPVDAMLAAARQKVLEAPGNSPIPATFPADH